MSTQKKDICRLCGVEIMVNDGEIRPLCPACKMDILLSMKKKGYNLKDTEDPAVLSMDLGNGYTLLASVKREWLISFDDGIQKTEYQIDSVKVPFTNSKDANKLDKEYCEALKAALDEVKEYHDSPVEVSPEVPEAEDAQKASEEAEKLAKLEAIMDGDAAGTIGKTPRSRQTVTAPQKKQEWNPATKQNTKPVEEIQDAVFKEVGPVDMSVLPVPVGIGIVRPAVTAIQALAAWQEFQELKKYIIERSDIQVIQGRNHIKKSGWRKFATFYNLTDQIVEETQVDLEKGGFYWKIKVVCTAPNGRQTEGVGMCASSEKSGARMLHDTYTTAHTRAKNRAISDMIAAGEVSAEEMEA